MVKKNKKAATNRLLFFGSISLLIICYFFISLVTYIYQVNSLNNEHKNLQKHLSVLEQNEEELKIEVQKLKDYDYLARYARENYMYSKNGEYVIKINKDQKSTNDNIENKELYKGYILPSAIVLIIVVFVVIVKKSAKTIKR